VLRDYLWGLLQQVFYWSDALPVILPMALPLSHGRNYIPITTYNIQGGPKKRGHSVLQKYCSDLHDFFCRNQSRLILNESLFQIMRNSASRSWTRAPANGVVVLTPWCSRMADILSTCSNNIQTLISWRNQTRCYYVVVILCEFCSVIKRHELLPSVIWNNDSYSPDGTTVVHN